jgi:hypothetical protein
LIRDGVLQAAKDGKARPIRETSVPVAHKGNERAPWLEPYGGDPDWRTEMWGAIVALHGRYPRALGALKENWWTDEIHTETLSALAVWRAEIDDTSVDPRDEIAFQTQLAAYAETLRREGGGVTKIWKPGLPPAPACRPARRRTPELPP